MHTLVIDPQITEGVVARTGREHPFEVMTPEKTALLVIDMQNYFLSPDFQGEVPMAREIVPNVNRLAAGLRELGGHVVWVKNCTTDTLESWSMFNNELMTPERRDTRYAQLDASHEGHALWPEMAVEPGDAEMVKKRFSAFIDGSSEVAGHLRDRGIDTVLIAGTATNVCCESSARDAMMMNFRTTMVHDALATYSDQQHNAALSAFYMLFGDVMSVDETLAALRRGAS